MKIYLIISIVFLSLNMQAQKKIKKLDVQEKGIIVKISFEPIENEFDTDSLIIKIDPLSANSLNSTFLYESYLNGKFNYSHFDSNRDSYFLKMKRKKWQSKSDYQLIMEGLEQLLDSVLISKSEFNTIKKDIIDYYSKTGNQFKEDKIITSNPFYIGNRYLSVFKLELTNTTQRYLIFNKKIIVQNINTIRPYTSEKIKGLLTMNKIMNQEKAIVLDKYYLPKTVIIPPNTKVEYLFATPPIDYGKKILKISLTNIKHEFIWNVIKNEKKIDNLFSYYEIGIDWYFDDFEHDPEVIFSLANSKTIPAYFSSGSIFIQDDGVNEKVNLLAILIYENHVFFVRKTIYPNQYIDFIKGRRKRIKLYPKVIKNLERNIKK